MRFVSGALAAASTLGMLGLGMYVNNVLVRGFAAHQLATKPDSINAEALLFGF